MVPVQDGYVTVKVDHIHQNVEDYPLDIPMPNAKIFILGGCSYLADLMEEKFYYHPAF